VTNSSKYFIDVKNTLVPTGNIMQLPGNNVLMQCIQMATLCTMQ